MAQEETHGNRHLTYSAWHRSGSLGRFVGDECARKISMIDADGVYFDTWIEYDDQSKIPLILVETAEDIGQRQKTATVTRNLALMAGLPAFIVLYRTSKEANPADPRYRDIDGFRVKRIFPEPETDWKEFTPDEWANYLVQTRLRSLRNLRKKMQQASEMMQAS